MKILARKVGDRPLGIWLAWAALLYDVIIEGRRAAVLLGFSDNVAWMPRLSDIFVNWPILIAAIVFLFMRRLIARAFVGMALVLMLHESLSRIMPLGSLLAVVGFWGLLVNRCWFDERLPRAGWRS